MAGILVVFATVEGQSRLIAEHVAATAIAAGHTATVRAVEDAAAEPPGWRDAIFVIGSIHLGRHAPALERWVIHAADALRASPSAFLSVSMSAARPEDRPQAEGYVRDFLAKTGWQPTMSATVAGALRYPEYGVLKRWMIRRIAGANGLPTDTSRAHVLTDWQELTELTLRFLEALPVPSTA